MLRFIKLLQEFPGVTARFAISETTCIVDFVTRFRKISHRFDLQELNRSNDPQSKLIEECRASLTRLTERKDS